MTDNGHGFSKQQRLLTPAAFRRVLRQQQRVRSHSFTVSFATNQQHCARLGIAVSRKVSKKAVVRNRIKRQIRETFRHHGITTISLDLVFIAKPAATQAGLRKELTTLWQKLVNIQAKHC